MADKYIPDIDHALDFLRNLRPAGPWWLVAIRPDARDELPHGHEFHPGNVESIESWIEGQNTRGRNIYYHVNVVAQPGNKAKAMKADVAAMAFVHVDVDPVKGRDVGEERARIHELVCSLPAHGMPEPTAVIDSGGGYQVLWALESPVHLGGDADVIEAAERMNRGAAHALGGDNCHNVDRVLRLPGTINWPDKAKQEAGRVPARAVIVFEDWERKHPADAFPVADAPVGQAAAAKVAAVQLSDDLPVFASGDALVAAGLSERGAAMAVQGCDPDKAADPLDDGDKSRSRWVHAFLCEAVRCGFTDDQMAAVVLDPDFAISDGVINSKSKRKPRAEAAHQIRGARRAVAAAAAEADAAGVATPDTGVNLLDRLKLLNRDHFLVKNYGGRHAIFRERRNEHGQVVLDTETVKKEMEIALANVPVFVEGARGPKRSNLATEWLNWPSVRRFDRVTFEPSSDPDAWKNTPGDGQDYNLWQGYAVDPAEDASGCELLLEHARRVVCNASDEHFAYLMGWMARCVQQPATQGEVALVLQGGKGTGKSMFADAFAALFGEHGMSVSQETHITGKFNDHQRKLVVLVAEESLRASSRQAEAVFKGLITGRDLTIEAKGRKLERSANYMHIILCSNDEHVVNATEDERRYFVLRMSDAHKQDHVYFAALANEIENGGKAALLRYLLDYDLSRFDVRRPPNTDALREQIAQGIPVELEWWAQRLELGTLTPDAQDWPADGCIAKEHLLAAWSAFMLDRGHKNKAGIAKLNKLLTAVMPEGWSPARVQRRVEGQRVSMYEIPGLGTCRATWAERHPHFAQVVQVARDAFADEQADVLAAAHAGVRAAFLGIYDHRAAEPLHFDARAELAKAMERGDMDAVITLAAMLKPQGER
jgi:hypothetical protein